MTDASNTGDSTEVKIAVIQEQIKGIREQQKVHADTTANNFSKVFESLGVINTSLSRGNGVFVACLAFAGAIGAAISWAIEFMSSKHL